MPNPSSIAPFIAAAIAHNPRAMKRMEGYIKGRHGAMLAEAEKTGLANHRIIVMGRAEHAVSARLALGFTETDDGDDDRLFRVFRAGWPEAMREAEQKPSPSFASVGKRSTRTHTADLPVMFELVVFAVACQLLGKQPVSPDSEEEDKQIWSTLSEWLLAIERVEQNGIEAMLAGRSFPQKLPARKRRSPACVRSWMLPRPAK